MSSYLSRLSKQLPAVWTSPPSDPQSARIVAHRAASRGVVGCIGLMVVLGLAFIGLSLVLALLSFGVGVLLSAFGPVAELADSGTLFAPFLLAFVFGMALLLSVVYVALVSVPAYLLCRLAIYTGFAGWAVALCSGAAVTLASFYLFERLGANLLLASLSYAVYLGAGFGATFWFCARFSTPEAFISTADT